jgi:hypothetical protein
LCYFGEIKGPKIASKAPWKGLNLLIMLAGAPMMMTSAQRIAGVIHVSLDPRTDTLLLSRS